MNKSIKHQGITALITILTFFSVSYIACKKPETTPTPDKCANIECQNGGTCFKGMCSCMGGFEGSRCEINTILRYTGEWKMKELVTGSNIPDTVGNSREYNVHIEPTPGTRTQFQIDNFLGAGYNDVVCQEGQNEKYEDDAYTAFTLVQSQNITGTYINIIKGSGNVNEFGTFMQGSYIINYIDKGQTKPVTDTVSFTASRIN